jgi:hypothetical protein
LSSRTPTAAHPGFNSTATRPAWIALPRTDGRSYNLGSLKLCEVLTSVNTTDIINNSYQDGPTVISLFKGQYLELDCRGADCLLQR